MSISPLRTGLSTQFTTYGRQQHTIQLSVNNGISLVIGNYDRQRLPWNKQQHHNWRSVVNQKNLFLRSEGAVN